MNFIFRDKALDFLNKKNIEKIFVNPDVDVKASCCSLAVFDLDISTKDSEDTEIIISAIGLGSFKKLYVENEINSIERW